jgi:hypothetical protein
MSIATIPYDDDYNHADALARLRLVRDALGIAERSRTQRYDVDMILYLLTGEMPPEYAGMPLMAAIRKMAGHPAH